MPSSAEKSQLISVSYNQDLVDMNVFNCIFKFVYFLEVNRLDQNSYIFLGSSLTSDNKCFRLNLTFDGNLILYHVESGHILWATEIFDPRIDHGYVDFSGNFVLYSKKNLIYFWQSSTFGNPGAFLLLQDNGNLVSISSTFCILLLPS